MQAVSTIGTICKQLDEIKVRISETTQERILGLHLESSGDGAHSLLFVPPLLWITG